MHFMLLALVLSLFVTLVCSTSDDECSDYSENGNMRSQENHYSAVA